MPSITLDQALYHRPDGDAPILVARSSGFTDDWLPEANRLVVGFGERTDGRRCPLTVFAMPIAAKQIAIVRVMDSRDGLRFHFLVLDQLTYENYVRDPFLLAAKVEPTWDAIETLPALMLPSNTFSPRTIADVQGVLKRVKAGALKEGDDPEAPDFQRTVENSESPAMLGGAQILVDGGRLIFERPAGDLPLVSGLWLFLPEATRSRLWPTTFAFSTELEFDVLVVPHVEAEMLEGYTTEDQAADYPDGAYELALQRAAEHGDQHDLDAVFSRRDGRGTIRLALILLAMLSVVVIFMRWPTDDAPKKMSESVRQQMAAVAGIVGVGDPIMSTSMIAFGKQVWKAEEKPRDAK